MTDSVDNSLNVNFNSVNKRLGVVQVFDTDNLYTKIENIFKEVFDESHVDYSYYQLNKLIKDINLDNSELLNDLIIKYIKNKIAIYEKIIQSCECFTFEMYVQIWKDYNSFFSEIESIILIQTDYSCVYQKINELTIIKIDTFYNNFFTRHTKILDCILNYKVKLSFSNIEYYIDYIESHRQFDIYLKNNLKTSPLKSLVDVFSNEFNLNLFVVYLDKLFKDLNNEVKQCNFGKKVQNKTIYVKLIKLATLLKKYSNNTLLLEIYSHYLKLRLTTQKYNNFEVELEVVNLLTYSFNKKEILLNIINEAMYNYNFTRDLRALNVVVEKEKYKKFTYDNLVLKPYFVTQHLWHLPNTLLKNIILMDEIKYYMKICKQIYNNTLTHVEKQTTIIWNLEFGCATIKAKLNEQIVTIYCTILQCNLLLFINNKTKFSVNDIELSLNIDYNLAFKLLESLIVSNIVTYFITDGSTENNDFTVNKNYTGNTYIDIRKIFIDLFKICV